MSEFEESIKNLAKKLVGATITKVENAHADESIARIHLNRNGEESSFVLFATELGFWIGEDKAGKDWASLQALIDAMGNHEYQKHYLDEGNTPYISVDIGIGNRYVGFKCTKCNELFKITIPNLMKSKWGKCLNTIEKREEFAKLLPYPPIPGLAPSEFPICIPIKGITPQNFMKKIKAYIKKGDKITAEIADIDRRTAIPGSVENMFSNIFAHNGPDGQDESCQCALATYKCCDSVMKRAIGFACNSCGKQFMVGLAKVQQSPIARFFTSIEDRAKIAKMLPIVYGTDFEKFLNSKKFKEMK